ncbi:MAG: hypothetical protein LBD25_08355 [Coriobacteriales bacterium]|nr:hypothetical protein [Coriobacteriales bacterium]
MAARLPQAAQGKAVAVSLFDQGFTAADLSYDEPWWTEGSYQPTGLISVFVDDTPLHMARYPNKIPGDFGGIDYTRFLYLKDAVSG